MFTSLTKQNHQKSASYKNLNTWVSLLCLKGVCDCSWSRDRIHSLSWEKNKNNNYIYIYKNPPYLHKCLYVWICEHVCVAYGQQTLVDFCSLHSTLPVWFFGIWCPLTSCQVHKPHSIGTHKHTDIFLCTVYTITPVVHYREKTRQYHKNTRYNLPTSYLLVCTSQLNLKQGMGARGEWIHSTYPLCALFCTLWNQLCMRHEEGRRRETRETEIEISKDFFLCIEDTQDSGLASVRV